MGGWEYSLFKLKYKLNDREVKFHGRFFVLTIYGIFFALSLKQKTIQ